MSHYIGLPFTYSMMYTFLKLTNWNTYIAFFYIFAGCILLTIFCLFYISYNDRKENSKSSWTVYICKNLLFLFITIFFYPILEYMLSLMDCAEIKGVYYHSAFTQIQCWTSLHILHSAIASCMSLIFVLFCLLISLVYFEAKMNTRDYNSKY